MVSLYRRATPAQAIILRIVEGACLNAQHAHPEMQLTARQRKSIAKRAVGTLTAQWPDVLAAAVETRPSQNGASPNYWAAAPGSPSPFSRAIRKRRLRLSRTTRREAFESPGRFPLRRLISGLSRPIKAMKLAGEHERAQGRIDALRLIDGLLNRGRWI